MGRRGGCCPYVELRLDHIIVIGNPISASKVAQEEQIKDEEGGAQHPTLRDTTDDDTVGL